MQSARYLSTIYAHGDYVLTRSEMACFVHTMLSSHVDISGYDDDDSGEYFKKLNDGVSIVP